MYGGRADRADDLYLPSSPPMDGIGQYNALDELAKRTHGRRPTLRRIGVGRLREQNSSIPARAILLVCTVAYALQAGWIPTMLVPSFIISALSYVFSSRVLPFMVAAVGLLFAYRALPRPRRDSVWDDKLTTRQRELYGLPADPRSELADRRERKREEKRRKQWLSPLESKLRGKTSSRHSRRSPHADVSSISPPSFYSYSNHHTSGMGASFGSGDTAPGAGTDAPTGSGSAIVNQSGYDALSTSLALNHSALSQARMEALDDMMPDFDGQAADEIHSNLFNSPATSPIALGGDYGRSDADFGSLGGTQGLRAFDDVQTYTSCEDSMSISRSFAAVDGLIPERPSDAVFYQYQQQAQHSLRQLRVRERDLANWSTRIRLWILSRVVQPVVRGLKQSDADFSRLSQQYLAQKGPNVTDRDRALFSDPAQFRKKFLEVKKTDKRSKTRRALDRYLQCGYNEHDYVSTRLASLSERSFSNYEWKGGGKGWRKGRPTDAEIVMHVFKTWMTKHIQSFEQVFYRRYEPSSRQRRRGDSRFPVIEQLYDDPPYFYISLPDESVYEPLRSQLARLNRRRKYTHLYVEPKRDNVFKCLALFLYLIDKGCKGRLIQTRLSDRALKGLGDVLKVSSGLDYY